jgi:hypothetical protein
VICDFVPVDGTPVRKAMCCSGFDFKAWRFMLNTLLYSALLHECATARRLSIASSVTDAIWFDVSDELEHEITKYTGSERRDETITGRTCTTLGEHRTKSCTVRSF